MGADPGASCAKGPVVRSPGPGGCEQRTRPTTWHLNGSAGPGTSCPAHGLSTLAALATSLGGCGSSLGTWRGGAGGGVMGGAAEVCAASESVRGSSSLAGPIAGQTSADWKVANTCR